MTQTLVMVELVEDGYQPSTLPDFLITLQLGEGEEADYRLTYAVDDGQPVELAHADLQARLQPSGNDHLYRFALSRSDETVTETFVLWTPTVRSVTASRDAGTGVGRFAYELSRDVPDATMEPIRMVETCSSVEVTASVDGTTWVSPTELEGGERPWSGFATTVWAQPDESLTELCVLSLGSTWEGTVFYDGLEGVRVRLRPYLAIRDLSDDTIHFEFQGARESEAVQEIAAPDAPTVTAPAAVVAGEPFTIEWDPNHRDGTAQRAWQVDVDGEVVETYRFESQITSYELTIDEIGTHQVRVRTEGWQVAGWSQWSLPAAVIVATPPRVDALEVPGTVHGYPIAIRAAASDDVRLESLSVAVLDGGSELYSATGEGPELDLAIAPGELALENGRAYAVRATATNSSGLTATLDASFEVDWQGPGAPRVTAEPVGYGVRIRAHAHEGEVATDSLTVQRVEPDGTLTEVARSLAPGGACVDESPDLNRELAYRVTAHAVSGDSATVAAARVDFEGACVVDWGEGRHTPIVWATSEDATIERNGADYQFPGVVDGEGLEVPVWYPSTTATRDVSVEAYIADAELAAEVAEMLLWTGPWHVRPLDGRGYWAEISGSLSRESRTFHATGRRVWSLSLTIRRCAGA